VIELEYSYGNQENMPFDSIWIKSTSGTSILRRFDITGSEGIIIVRNDSLLTNLTINSVADSIQIFYAIRSMELSNEPLIYGYPNASIKSPENGQSIARPYTYSNLYCLDKSPTIGEKNDTVGMCGTLKGKIFDKDNKLITGMPANTFEMVIKKYISDIPIIVSPDGSYYSDFYAFKATINELYYRYGNNQGEFINISSIDINMQPDSVITIDIHILDSLKSGVNEIYDNLESIIKLFPNPVSGIKLNYEIAIPVKSSNCIIKLVNMEGKQLDQFEITENQGELNLPSSVKNGMYSFLLYVNNRYSSTSRILILR
jgi:hypothetical protein